MVDFMKAVEWLNDGIKIRCSRWCEKAYCFVSDKQGIVVKHTDKKDYPITLLDVKAIDWEIYTEEDNWNLANEINNLRDRHDTKGMDWELIEEYFKTFIQKVKLDLSNEYESDIFDKINEVLDKRAGEL